MDSTRDMALFEDSAGTGPNWSQGGTFCYYTGWTVLRTDYIIISENNAQLVVAARHLDMSPDSVIEGVTFFGLKWLVTQWPLVAWNLSYMCMCSKSKQVFFSTKIYTSFCCSGLVFPAGFGTWLLTWQRPAISLCVQLPGVYFSLSSQSLFRTKY